MAAPTTQRTGPLGMTGYQWFVLFAAWLGWGFDAFDALLFNYVAHICIPDLLHLDPQAPTTRATTTFWTGAITSVLLVGWAVGGVLFGRVTDRIGRSRTLLLTMFVYAISTAACAFAPNIWVLVLFRFLASLGIGGEWAAGASLVAETVPENRRVQAGALLYTSAPAGLFLATFVNDLFTKQLDFVKDDPSLSWRVVFLTGIIPAVVAIAIRYWVKESERWQPAAHVPFRALFRGDLARRTLGGFAMSCIALVTWWSVNAFVPLIAGFLADDVQQGVTGTSLADLRVALTTHATTMFNLGGLAGTLCTVPIATHLGRRPMFVLYFLASAGAIALTFGPDLGPYTRVYLLGLVGLTVFGVFGSFTFYLPELFPTHLRGTGAGFCYNTGRIVTAFFPFLIGHIALSGANPIAIIRWVAVVPLIGVVLILLGLGHETRHQTLA